MATFVRTQEIEHELGDRGRLALRVTDPDVEMRATDGTLARVRVTFQIRATTDGEADEAFQRLRFDVSRGDGFLDVSAPKHGAAGIGSLVRLFGTGGGRADVSVAVDAPREAEVHYDGVSADLTATGFRGPQEYRTVSGDLVLDSVGGTFQIRGVSSDVSIRADAPLRNLEVNTVSGDVSAIAPRIDRLHATTVSGDLELEALLAVGAEHRVETVSGDLSLGAGDNLTVEVRGLSSDADIRLPHRSEGSRDRRRYVIGEGAAQVLFRSMSGDIEVRPPRRGSPQRQQPPQQPPPPTPPAPPAVPGIGDDAQLAVLQALERGEIDVDEAARRLAGRSPADV